MIERHATTEQVLGNILFIHGMCHGAWCWDQGFTESFVASGYNCFSIDLSGHELPGKNKGINKISLEDYVKDVQKAIDHIGEPPIIIGHSMGGFVTQKFLEIYACKAAVLLASVPYFGILPSSFRYLAKHPKALYSLLIQDIYSPFVKYADELYGEPETFNANVKYRHLMRAESFKALVQMMFQPIKKANPHGVPLLVIGAEHDSVIKPKEVKKTADFYLTEAHMLEDFGHNLMLDENHPQVAKQILNWLEENG